MLRLFRRLRNQVLDQKQASRYLLYALGEIVLVMIGILLALQVSQWTQQRQRAKQEVNTLRLLHEEIQKNNQNLAFNSRVDSLHGELAFTLVDILKDPAGVWADSLERYFGELGQYPVFYAERIIFDNLRETGADLISNDSLRTMINSLYENGYTALEKTINPLRRQGYYDANNDYLLQRVETRRNLSRRVPNDFAALKNDQEFINFLTFLGAYRIRLENIQRLYLNTGKRVETAVAKELERLER